MKTVFTLILSFFTTMLFCQSLNHEQDKEKEVIDVVVRLFDGMRKGDSSMVSSTMDPSSRLTTVIKSKEGKVILKDEKLKSFLEAVAQPHEVVWDEKIYDWQVQVNGNLAQVWTKYSFYAGTKFSHCGIDAFQLYKTPSGWKIFQLTDTRQREGCDQSK